MCVGDQNVELTIYKYVDSFDDCLKMYMKADDGDASIWMTDKWINKINVKCNVCMICHEMNKWNKCSG